MSFVLTAWKLTIFLLLVAAFFFFNAYASKNDKKSVIKVRSLLFIIAACYLAFAHFSMFVAIGQSLDENYQAPCEWKINQSRESFIYGDNYTGYHWDYSSPVPNCNPNDLDCVNLFHVNTTYTYFDTCANREAPPVSVSLVVIFTWLLWIGAFGTMLYVMLYLINLARRFV